MDQQFPAGEPLAVAEETAPVREGWQLSTFRALRHRNYRLYFVGQMVSLVGSWVQTTALMWLAWDLTKQSLWPGLVTAAQVVPTFLLGAWGGSLADRWPRRPLIFATQVAFLALAILLWLLTWLGQITAWQLFAVSLGAGFVNAVDLPARLAFVMDMVGREDLPNAVALNSLLFNTARAAGPALSAWMLSQLTVASCFLVNALTFVAVLFALAAMDPSRTVAVGLRPAVPLVEAFHFLGERPALLLLLSMTGAMAFFGWPVLTLLPALAEHQLTSGHKEFSSLVSTIGFGAIAGSLLVASLNPVSRQRILLAAGILLAVLGLAGLSQVESLHWAWAFCTLLGAGLIIFLATGQSVVQLSTADSNRGRILGVWSMVLTGAVPLGNLAAGAAADVWGVATVLGWQAAGLVAAAGVIGLLGTMIGGKSLPGK